MIQQTENAQTTSCKACFTRTTTTPHRRDKRYSSCGYVWVLLRLFTVVFWFGTMLHSQNEMLTQNYTFAKWHFANVYHFTMWRFENMTIWEYDTAKFQYIIMRMWHCAPHPLQNVDVFVMWLAASLRCPWWVRCGCDVPAMWSVSRTWSIMTAKLGQISSRSNFVVVVRVKPCFCCYTIITIIKRITAQ